MSADFQFKQTPPNFAFAAHVKVWYFCIIESISFNAVYSLLARLLQKADN